MSDNNQQGEALKPCPFCACKVFKEKFEKFSATTAGILGFSYRCPKCRSQFAVFGKTEAEAMKVWNTRARTSVAAVEGDAHRLTKLYGEIAARCFIHAHVDGEAQYAVAMRDVDEAFKIDAAASAPLPAEVASELQALRDENKRLRDHVADLNHDLDESEKHCKEYHS